MHQGTGLASSTPISMPGDSAVDFQSGEMQYQLAQEEQMFKLRVEELHRQMEYAQTESKLNHFRHSRSSRSSSGSGKRRYRL